MNENAKLVKSEVKETKVPMTSRQMYEFQLETVKRTISHVPYPIEHWLLHACLGLSTEVGEVYDCLTKAMFMPRKIKTIQVPGKPPQVDNQIDMKNLLEEFGDMIFFITLLCSELDLDYDQLAQLINEPIQVPHMGVAAQVGLNGLVTHSLKALDFALHQLYHGHKIDVKQYAIQFAYCFICIGLIGRYCHISLEQIIRANRAKLEKRYPNGFEVDKSINRDTTAEQQAVENIGKK
jgi:NTP pyrophosphatase (non-canonical NTP hydrolase)